MKKILSIFTVLFTVLSFGQNVDPYLQPNSSATSGQWNKGTLQVDGDFVLPTTLNSFTNPSLRDYGKLRYDTNDSIPKFHNGERWIGLGKNYFDVRDFGGIPGDGIDDAPAINAAMQATTTSDIKDVYNCGGIWDIGTTVHLVDGVNWFGDGPENTILRNIPSAETGLDLVTIIDGVVINPDIYDYRTMVASEGADYTVADTISGFKIHDMGFDWNGVPGGVNSALELLLAHVEDYEVYNVKFYDALPSDLEDVNEERQGHQVLLAFSTRGYFDNIHLGASDYESLSIRYLSHDNHFGTIYGYVDKPDTYHWQTHIIQIARPTVAKEQLILQYGDSICRNNTFDKLILHTKNNVLHGLTTHSAEGVHIGTVYHKSYAGANALAWGVKFFDESKNVTIDTFIEDAIDANTNAFPSTTRGVTSNGVSFIGINSTSEHDEVQNVTIGNVLINVKNTVDYDGVLPSYIAPMIGGCNISRGSNVTFGNVVVNVDGYDDYAKPVFGGFGDNITVESLSVNYANPFETITSAGPVIAKIKEGDNIAINNIQVTGDIGNGVLIDDADFHNVRLGSMVYEGNVAGSKLSTGLTNQSEIKVFVNSINGTTADADGNISLSIPTVDAAPTDGSSNAVSSNGVFDALALKLPLVPGGTDIPYTGGGSISAPSLVRSQTISSDPTGGATTQLTSGTNFREAVWLLQNQVNLKANKAGDTYTGTHNFTGATITVPTQSAGDFSNKAASTEYVDLKVSNSVTDGVTQSAPSQNAVYDFVGSEIGEMHITNDAETVAQTASDLNTEYPSAPKGTMVIMPNVGTGTIYIKTGGVGQWIAVEGTILNP